MLIVRQKSRVARFVSQGWYDAIRPLQKCYWFLFRPYRPGVKTFIFCKGNILLVQIGYSHKSWVIPGGGIDRREQPVAAARREAEEETGIAVTNVSYVGERSNTRQYKRVTVFYYAAEVDDDTVVIDGQEIIDAAWFPLDALPTSLRQNVREEITMHTNWKHRDLYPSSKIV
jgi:ADP-ribose pyrophosphatase YjhB (NUDIX family)